MTDPRPELDPPHPKYWTPELQARKYGIKYPGDWNLDVLLEKGPVCRYCIGGEEHHGVGRAQAERIEQLELKLTRVYVEVLALLHPSLAMEVDALLDDPWAPPEWGGPPPPPPTPEEISSPLLGVLLPIGNKTPPEGSLYDDSDACCEPRP